MMKTSYVIAHDSTVDLKEFRYVMGLVLANHIETRIGENRLVGLSWHEKPGEFGWILEHEAA